MCINVKRLGSGPDGTPAKPAGQAFAFCKLQLRIANLGTLFGNKMLPTEKRYDDAGRFHFKVQRLCPVSQINFSSSIR